MVDFGHKLGIESPLNADLSLALGTSETTLMELTAAYAVFPNMGYWIKPHGVLTVQDRAGRTIWQAKPDKRAVLSRESAAIVTNMLEGVIHEGTGRKASRIGKQIAGKTGTTSNYRDALFVGFSPSIVTGVWVGNDSGATLGKNETGARAALPIWIDFMQAASKSDNHQYFDIPDNVIRTRMNPISGLPASQNDAAAVKALFKKGTEPRNQ
jgi:penicillin-binding protein 1A